MEEMREGKAIGLFAVAMLLLILFAVLNAAILMVDVQPVGPLGSQVGLATVNDSIFRNLGTSQFWYEVTETLGKCTLLVAAGFGVAGLIQWIRRKSLFRVDAGILIMAGLYVVLGVIYLFFEKCIINYRPVLLDGVLEASFPSSHTMLSLCIWGSALLYFRQYLWNRPARTVLTVVCVAAMAVMVVGRLLSGVHWFTDIMGSIVLSAALVSLYAAMLSIWAEPDLTRQ